MTDCVVDVISSYMIMKESLSLVLRSQFMIEGRLKLSRCSWCCDSALVAPACCFFVLYSSRTTCYRELYLRTALFLLSIVSRKATIYMSVSNRTLSGRNFFNCSYILLLFSFVAIILTAFMSSSASLLLLLLEIASCSNSRVLPQVVLIIRN